MFARDTLTRRHALLALASALPACVTTPPPEALPAAGVTTPLPEAVPAAGVTYLGGLAFVNALPGSDRYRGGAVLRQTVARVHDIAYRLRLRGVGLCGSKRAAEPGFVAGNFAALDALGLASAAPVTDREDGLTVWHVVAGSPAASAGLREGDVIEHIGGRALPVGTGALDALRDALGGDASQARSVTLQLRRGPSAQVLDLRPESGCDMPVVLVSDHGLAWAGGEMPLADTPDALLAFALAHSAALRLDRPRRALAIGGSDIGEGIDFTLSMLSLALGLVTLGGWPAKPVDIFKGSAGTARGEAEARLRDEADLAADALALKMLHQAGFDAEPLFAVWLATVDRTGQAGMRHRLERMREQWSVLVAGRAGR